MKKICIFLLVIIMFNTSIFIKVSAAEDTERTYRYEGYTVTYNIISSWKSNQNVSITITNTSNESIVGWALKYNANGKIYDLWNGIAYSCDDTKYVIKNAGYNYEIKPFESITFGYTLTGENLSIPSKIEICSQKVKKESGLTVNISVPKGYLGPTPSRPLMQTDSINSIVISGSGITYNVHTEYVHNNLSYYFMVSYFTR